MTIEGTFTSTQDTKKQTNTTSAKISAEGKTEKMIAKGLVGLFGVGLRYIAPRIACTVCPVVGTILIVASAGSLIYELTKE